MKSVKPDFLWKSAVFAVILGVFSGFGFSQTTLINPAAEGGFESGSTFASNGWTVVNGTGVTNQWYVGTAATGFTNNSAYVSNDGGVTNGYDASMTSVVHFYRDVTIPAGETQLTLSFNWKALGETGFWDALMVSIAPTSYTPVGTTATLSNNFLAAPAVEVGRYWNSSSAAPVTVSLPNQGNCSAPVTIRLIFSWKNDNGGGSNPSAAVDNISLVSQSSPITSAGGTFTIDNTLATGGANFASFTAAINALNTTGSCLAGPVTFNVAAGQTFAELPPVITATGTAANPIIFQRSGAGVNPVIVSTGTAGTDAGIALAGGDYFTFDGIDINASASNTMEFGYLVRSGSSGTDGAMNNTLKNFKVMMARGGSSGIAAVAVTSSLGGSATPTAASGASSNNTVKDFTIDGAFNGVQLVGGSATYPDANNTITTALVTSRNVVMNIGPTTATSTSAAGIIVNGESNATVNNCDISAVASNKATAQGIYFTNVKGNSFITGNKVMNISNTGSASTTAVAYGIQAQNSTSGTNVIRIANNMVSNLSTTFTGTATVNRYAIGIQTGTPSASSAQSYEVYNNSVSIGSGLTPTYSTSCYELQNISAVYKVRNNIFANFTGAQTGAARHYAWVTTSGTSIGAAGSISDNNDLYVANNLGTTGFIGRANTTEQNSLVNWTAAITGYPGTDANSTSSDPQFVNNNTNLHLNLGVTPSRIESGGSSVGVSTDIDGDVRPGPVSPVNGGSTAPDMGADEFDGVPLPAPVITLNSVTPPASAQCVATARVVSVNVTTASGTITNVVLAYAVNGTAQTPITMTAGSGSEYHATIPVPTPTNATIVWSVAALSSIGQTATYNGTSYSDEPVSGVVASATASTTTVCSGNASTLTAKLQKSVTVALGAGSSTTTGSGTSGGNYVSPFSHYFGGYKAQYIVRASELTALGLAAGNLTSLAFDVTTAGITYNSFTLSIAPTAATAANATFLTGSFTDVYTGNLAVTATGLNTITFATPFNWDGTSNIIVQLCWSNNNTGGTAAEVKYDGTSFVSQAYLRADNTDPATLCSNPTATGTQSNRPKMVFAGNGAPAITAISWSNGVTTVGTTNPLTVNPTATTTYTPTITAAGCTVSPSPTVVVNVNPLPAAPTATNSAQCGVQIPTASVSSTTGLPTPTFNWYAASSGGSALQSSTSTTYTSTVSTTTTFYVSEMNTVTGCESTRTPVTVNVATPDAVSLTASTGTICIGNSFTLTAANIGAGFQSYSYSTSSTAGSGAQTPLNGSPVTVTPTSSGSYTYTVTGVDGGCAATATATVQVNALPVITTATATPATVCSGDVITLTANSLGTATTGNIGSGAQTTSFSYASPFYHNYGGVKTQFIIPASELTAQGFAAGNINSIGLNVATVGTTYAGFTIYVGPTGNTDLSGGFVPMAGLTQVYSNPLLTLTAASLNTFTLSTPFAWDGTSNLIIQTSWSNNNGGGSSSEVLYDNTAYVSTAYARADNNTPASILAITTNNSTVSARPEFHFVIQPSFTSGINWNWTPGTGLNTATASTSVTNMSGSAVSQAYTVTATSIATGCVATTTTSPVTINPVTAAPVATNSTQCGPGVPTASVTGTGNPGNSFSWFTASSGGTAIAGQTGTTYTASVSTTTTFYVSEYNGSCMSARTPVTVTVTAPPAISVTGTAIICDGTSDLLTVTSSNDPNYTYTWSGGLGTGASVTAMPSTNTTYTVTATDMSGGANDGCNTSATFAITVNSSPTAVTAAASTSTICAGTSVNLTSSAMPNDYQSATLNEGFEGTFPPSGWTMLNVGSSNPWTASTTSHSGSGGMQYHWVSSAAANAWAITPQVYMLAGQTYSVTFWYEVGGSTYPEKLKVTVGNAATIAAQTTVIWNNNGGPNLTNTTWAQGTATYTPATSGNYYVGFNCFSDLDEYYLYVDDISVQYSVGSASATYAWTSSPAGFTSGMQNPTGVTPAVTTTYTVSASNSYGCSTTASTTVTVNALPTVGAGTDQVVCAGTSVTLSGSGATSYSWNNGVTNGTAFTPTATQTYTVTGTDANGCTNTDQVMVTVNALPTVNAGVDQNVCSGTPVTLTASGTATFYTWNNGVTDGVAFTPTSTATYAVHGTDANGCLNSDTVTVGVGSQSSSTVNQTSCSSFTMNGTIYNTSGTYTQVIPNMYGCDSTITLNLTITQPSSSTVTATQCSSYTLNGTTYNTSGTYTQVIPNAANCDSTITLHLTITQPSSSSVSATACGSYTWAQTGATYTASGAYTHTLMNAAGCDSVITLNLTINAVPVATATLNNFVLTASSGASYQWINCATGAAIAGATSQTYTTTANGLYAVIVHNASGCSDTSACVNVTGLGVKELTADNISIFPNPTHNAVTVVMTVDAATIEVLDATGKLLQSMKVMSGDKIDLSAYETGVYFLNVKTESGSSLTRIVKD